MLLFYKNPFSRGLLFKYFFSRIFAGIFFLFSASLSAQVGIGTDNPEASAALDIVSTSKGLLVSRMTQAQRAAVISPAEALLVYQTDGTTGFYYFKSGDWIRLNDAFFSSSTTSPTVVVSENGTSSTVNLSEDFLLALGAKEDLINKSTDLVIDADSNVKYPTVKAVVDYIATRLASDATGSGSSGSGDSSGSSDGSDSGSGDSSSSSDGSGTSSASVTTPDATATNKGKIQLAGDLTGTAAAPEIASGAISSSKLASAAVTTDKIANAAITAAKTDGSFEALSNKSNSIVSDGSSTTKYPTVKAVKDYVDASSSGSGGGGSGSGDGSGSGSVSDATTSAKGIVQLAGDLSGTAALPAIAAGAISTAKISDAAITTAKLSDATVTAAKLADAAITTSKLLDASVTAAKTDGSLELLANKSVSITTDAASDSKYPSVKAVKTYVDANSGTVSDATTLAKGVVQLAGDLTGTAALPTIANAAITTAKLSDATVTTAKLADAAITTAKLLDASVTAAKTDGSLELLANKSVSITTDAASDSKYPSVKAVKTYVDNTVSTGSMTDATTSAKGAVQLAGDLAGTADAPLVGNLKITAAKIANNAVVLTSKVTGTLPVSNGGTGATTISGLVKGNGISAFTAAVVGTDYSLVREVADEFTASSSQTSFTLSQTPSNASKVRMFINGVRISNSAYSHSARTLTYNPTNNGSYSLTTGDRIQFDYYY